MEGGFMFVQVIQGRTTDPEGMRRQLERFNAEVRPGAKGFLGSTGGFGAGGQVFAIARFESRAAAEANAKRAEQTAWWNELEKYYAEPPVFHDCTEVDVYRDGGSDKATFIQVIQGRADRTRVQKLDKQAESLLPNWRPDLLGSIRAWDGDAYTEVAYFTNEKEARQNEQKPMPEESGLTMNDFIEAMGNPTFLDLTDVMMMGPA
jgi:hypothetical protein